MRDFRDINNTEVCLSYKSPTGPARQEQDQYFADTDFPSAGEVFESYALHYSFERTYSANDFQ